MMKDAECLLQEMKERREARRAARETGDIHPFTGRLAALEARKKAWLRHLSQRLVHNVCETHTESLRLLGDHKE
ncbi:MAG: hypothetical protein HY558_08200 [Euryarchaeota archaeon]|nr:hypothetical protein [Euryarchaeota archaeon]